MLLILVSLVIFAFPFKSLEKVIETVNASIEKSLLINNDSLTVSTLPAHTYSFHFATICFTYATLQQPDFISISQIITKTKTWPFYTFIFVYLYTKIESLTDIFKINSIVAIRLPHKKETCKAPLFIEICATGFNPVEATIKTSTSKSFFI